MQIVQILPPFTFSRVLIGYISVAFYFIIYMLKSSPAFSHYFLSHLTSPCLSLSKTPPLTPPPAASNLIVNVLLIVRQSFKPRELFSALKHTRGGQQWLLLPKSPPSLIHKTEEKRSELIKVFSVFYCAKVGQSRQTLTPLAAGICDSSPGLYDITLQATWHKEDDCSIGSHFCHVRSICWCCSLIHKQRRNIYFFFLRLGKNMGEKDVCLRICCCFSPFFKLYVRLIDTSERSITWTLKKYVCSLG